MSVLRAEYKEGENGVGDTRRGEEKREVFHDAWPCRVRPPPAIDLLIMVDAR